MEQEDTVEWEDFPDELAQTLQSLGIENPEAMVVVSFDEGTGQHNKRSFAQSHGEREPSTPDRRETLGHLEVFGAKFVTNSPLRCYWNGHKWECY